MSKPTIDLKLTYEEVSILCAALGNRKEHLGRVIIALDSLPKPLPEIVKRFDEGYAAADILKTKLETLPPF